MSKKKAKKFDKIKALKRLSRKDEQLYGKAGVHSDKRERRQRKLTTQDYLAELDDYGGPIEDTTDDGGHLDGGQGADDREQDN